MAVAKFRYNPSNEIRAIFSSNTGTRDHNVLINRDLPDQHPMSAITGLEDALKTFVFEQGIASVEWEIEHNLNKYPSVFVVDSAGTVQIPDTIQYDSENKMTLTFLAAFAGKAYLN